MRRNQRFSVLLLILCFLLSMTSHRAYAETSFSTLYVDDYVKLCDLNRDDALVVDDWFFINLGWIRDQFEDAQAWDFYTTGRYSDFIYYTGHGYAPPYPGGSVDPIEPSAGPTINTWEGALCFKYWGDSTEPTTQKRGCWIKDDTSNANSLKWRYGFVTSSLTSKLYGYDTPGYPDRDVEWLYFAACDELRRNGWRYAFNRGINLILGYRDLSTEGRDEYITDQFFKYVTGSIEPPADTLWSPFIKANHDKGLAGYDRVNWAINGYLNHRYDWLHGFNPPPGYTNYTPYAYSDENAIYQWNESNYLGTPYHLTRAPKPIWYLLWIALKNLFWEDRAHAQAPLSLAQGKVLVETPLSEEKPLVASVSIKKEEVQAEEMAQRLLQGNLERKEFEGIVSYTDGKNGVSFYPIGAFTYGNESLETIPTKMSEEEARKKAEEFIERMGGLKEGYFLSKVSTINQEKLSTGESEIIAWCFEYRPKVKGIPIVGPGGPQIDIIVSDSGIFHCLSYTPSFQEGSSKRILSQKEAVEKAASKMADNFKPRLPVTIEKVEFAYHSPSFDEQGTDLKPVWCLQTDKGEVYVDAILGEVLTGPLK